MIEVQQGDQFHRQPQMTVVHRVERAAEDADRRSACSHGQRTCPSPKTTYFCDVSPSRPTGPRACSLSVEMPISAPRPYSKPSAKRVEALTMTEDESTARMKARARMTFSITMTSIWYEPQVSIWSMASSMSSTILTARIAARYSSAQSLSLAG